jgi:hypothetical protein
MENSFAGSGCRCVFRSMNSLASRSAGKLDGLYYVSCGQILYLGSAVIDIQFVVIYLTPSTNAWLVAIAS